MGSSKHTIVDSLKLKVVGVRVVVLSGGSVDNLLNDDFSSPPPCIMTTHGAAQENN